MTKRQLTAWVVTSMLPVDVVWRLVADFDSTPLHPDPASSSTLDPSVSWAQPGQEVMNYAGHRGAIIKIGMSSCFHDDLYSSLSFPLLPTSPTCRVPAHCLRSREQRKQRSRERADFGPMSAYASHRHSELPSPDRMKAALCRGRLWVYTALPEWTSHSECALTPAHAAHKPLRAPTFTCSSNIIITIFSQNILDWVHQG